MRLVRVPAVLVAAAGNGGFPIHVVLHELIEADAWRYWGKPEFGGMKSGSAIRDCYPRSSFISEGEETEEQQVI